MSKKNKRNKGIVYSTDPNYGFDDEQEEIETLAPEKQMLRIRLDRLKGNKVATVIWDFEGANEDLKDLGKRLKDKCGCGGTVKKGEILLQGDFRDRIKKELSGLGYKFKMVGG